MQYEIVVDAERTVNERYRVTVEADNEEEAVDIAWEVVSDPECDLTVERKLKEREATTNIVVNFADVERSEADEVFDDGA